MTFINKILRENPSQRFLSVQANLVMFSISVFYRFSLRRIQPFDDDAVDQRHVFITVGYAGVHWCSHNADGSVLGDFTTTASVHSSYSVVTPRLNQSPTHVAVCFGLQLHHSTPRSCRFYSASRTQWYYTEMPSDIVPTSPLRHHRRRRQLMWLIRPHSVEDTYTSHAYSAFAVCQYAVHSVARSMQTLQY